MVARRFESHVPCCLLVLPAVGPLQNDHKNGCVQRPPKTNLLDTSSCVHGYRWFLWTSEDPPAAERQDCRLPTAHLGHPALAPLPLHACEPPPAAPAIGSGHRALPFQIFPGNLNLGKSMRRVKWLQGPPYQFKWRIIGDFSQGTSMCTHWSEGHWHARGLLCLRENSAQHRRARQALKGRCRAP